MCIPRNNTKNDSKYMTSEIYKQSTSVRSIVIYTITMWSLLAEWLQHISFRSTNILLATQQSSSPIYHHFLLICCLHLVPLTWMHYHNKLCKLTTFFPDEYSSTDNCLRKLYLFLSKLYDIFVQIMNQIPG